MKTILKSFLLLVIATLISSCASIVSTSNWPLTVNTKPSGAKISIIDKKNVEVFKGTSPATLKLKSGAGYFAKQSYKVKLNLEGYPERVIPVECKVNGWYIAGNFVIGGFLGWLIVDPLTGAMYKLDMKVINEDFGQKTSYIEPTLKIIDIRDIPNSMKEHLICINK
jgi:hypothetical protein